jgi:hypothetical protein
MNIREEAMKQGSKEGFRPFTGSPPRRLASSLL